MAKWTSQEISTLCQNYPYKGSRLCAQMLNKSLVSVRSKASKLGLCLLPETKNRIQKLNSLKIKPKLQKDHNVNINVFNKDFTLESAYVLGFLWADGYLHQTYSILTECLREDLDNLFPRFLATGKWNISYRNRHNRRPQAKIHTSNKEMSSFLTKHNYGPKNYGSPTILKIVPKSLHYMWFRGVIDGDGCWYYNKNQYLRQFSIAGAFEQDWELFKESLSDLGVVCKATRRTQQRKDDKSTSSSVLRVTGRCNILTLGEYVYNGYEGNPIGLKRKYDKWIQIRDSYLCHGDRQACKI